jgi:hypothetical protein
VLFAHPYPGLQHDAILYALQALRSLEPQALSDDLFFRYGSQDSYTLFSPLYVALIRLFGLEPAAHLIARFSLLGLLAGALLLARRMMERELAWLAIALFIAIPGNYGAYNILKYAENFATPRTLTEALVIASFVLLLDGRRIAALAMVGVGFLFHPLMAVPGLLGNLLFQARRTTSVVLLAVGAIAILLATAIAYVAPFGPLRLVDPAWHDSLAALVPYLLLEYWSVEDWQPTVVALVTLVAAMQRLEAGPSRRLATVSAIVGGAGIVIAGMASVAPVALFLQGQAWRWMWLGKALAVLLLAPLAAACWRRGGLARAALALLTVAWVARNDAIGVVAGLLALLAVTADAGELPDRWRRLAAWGCWLLAAMLALAVLRVHFLPLDLLLVLASVTIWWLLFRARHLGLRLTGAAAAAALCGLQLATMADPPRGVTAAPHYDSDTERRFASWRSRIGEHETVFFPEHPEMVWLVLHRKSYVAYAAAVFSRDAALETRDRDREIHSLVPLTAASGPTTSGGVAAPYLSAEAAGRACRVPEIDYIITRTRLPAPALASDAPPPLAGLLLYACADVRSATPG